MRKTADISFEATLQTPAAASAVLAQASAAVEAWIFSKGIHEPELEQDNFLLEDQRIATLTRKVTDVAGGTLLHVRVQEPLDAQIFDTELRLAMMGSGVAVACELRVGAATPGAPIRFEVHLPRVVRDIIGLSESWSVAGTPISTRAALFMGAAAGDELAAVLWQHDRSIPVIVVSDHNGLLLAPGIHDVLARECAGAALVVRADRDACWQLTALKGAEWSCFNGAIRLYYPRIADLAEPRRHPLWVPRFFGDIDDATNTERRLRALLRRLTLSYSAFSTYVPSILAEAQAAIDASLRAVVPIPMYVDQDWQAMATSYGVDNARLQKETKALRDEVVDLRVQLSNVQSALGWNQPAETQDPPPAQMSPPATVKDAVDQAALLYPDDLVFGNAVQHGVAGLAPDSGPPSKILAHLKALSELAQARRKGPLGENVVTWLRRKGVPCSPESETIRGNVEERTRRTWDDGCGASRFFDLHLKPTDATSPDRCVRIYCEYDDNAHKTIVGWVGRKEAWTVTHWDAQQAAGADGAPRPAAPPQGVGQSRDILIVTEDRSTTDRRQTTKDRE